MKTAAGAAAGAWAAVGTPVLVHLVRRGLARLGVSGDAELAALAAADGHGDPGWFGPDSVTWRVHADTSMLVAGMTAFALQTLHPPAMAGVWDHSALGGDFFGRTRRTSEFVQGVVYDPTPAGGGGGAPPPARPPATPGLPRGPGPPPGGGPVGGGAGPAPPPRGGPLLGASEPPLPEVAACRAVVRAVGRLLGEPLPLRR